MPVGIAARAHKSQEQLPAQRRRGSTGLLVVTWAVLASVGIAAAQEPKQLVTAERYQIDIAFQPEKGFLHARAAVTLRAAQVAQAIEFELNPHLTLQEVTDAQGRKLDFARSQRLGSPKLSVRLSEPIATGEKITLNFTYEGVLPPGRLDYITSDGILLRDESRWYPAVDLAAFTQNDVTITVPSGWIAVSSGPLVEAQSVLNGAAFHQETPRPVSSRSIVAFPQGPRTCSAAVGGTGDAGVRISSLIETCFPPGNEASGSRMGGRVSAVNGWYSQLLKRDSDLKLVLVQGFPGQHGAIGYSAPGFLVVSEEVVKFFDYPGYAPEFLPHEVAHQWFPIEVTIARQEDAWLAESLAEYLAWRCLQETNPEQARLMVTRAMRDALGLEPLRPLSLGLRLFALENWEVAHATLYQRGLLVWRTLETVIDRERVDRALREYYKRYAGRSASIADFRKVCEEISGRDLGWFFDYFIRGTRIPEIQIHRRPPTAPGEVAGEIILRNVPAEFQVRVEMRLETSAGAVDHSVATRGEATPFTVTSAAPVTRLTLDPGQRILRWTEAARRNRSQRGLLAGIGEIETAGKLAAATQICRKALALDPENLAANEQQVRFELGRLRYRMKQYESAFREFARVLTLASLDPMTSDFNRAWARVYRARIEKLRGHRAATRTEAQAGLASKSPALESQVTLPEAPGRATTAAAELRALVQ
jgi:tetratricopeptide (TPR) repeat protein